jgi:hypothetical protein
MPDQSSIEQTILNGKYSIATLVNNNLTLVNGGQLPIRTGFIDFYNLSLQGLIYQYSINDYTSSTTTALYDRINNFVGIPAGAQVDPNAQLPNTTIIVEGGGGTAKSEPIYFNNQTTVTITSYQNLYVAQFGNSPILQIYVSNGDGTYSQDTGTTPTITYVGGIIANGINTITWTYPIATSGYVIIMGVSQ